MSLKTSMRLGLVASVRSEFDPSARTHERTHFVDLALVNGGSVSIVIKSWEVEEWKADDYAGDPDALVEFVAEKIGAVFA